MTKPLCPDCKYRGWCRTADLDRHHDYDFGHCKLFQRQMSQREAAKQEFVQACRAEDPKAIALATIRLAMETPEVIEGIRNSLRMIPFLTLKADLLRSLPPRRRRALLIDEWRMMVGPNNYNQRAERIVVGAAMEALGGKKR